MMQNICKKFLLLLMFSLLRVDVLSMDINEENKDIDNETKKNEFLNINENNNTEGEEKEKNKSSDNEYNADDEKENEKGEKKSGENLNIDTEYSSEEEEEGNENIDKKNIPANFSWDNIQYTGKPKKDISNFIENKVNLEEFEKKNKKTLEVLGILEDVNNALVKNKNDENEARINSKLTSFNNPSFEEDINTNENDDVNTIRTVNSILEKKINGNKELETLRKNQREKDLNGAINSYYELCQAKSEIENIENEIKEDNKKIEEGIEIVKAKEKVKEEIDEGIKLEEEIRQLREEEIQKYKEEELVLAASKKVLNTEKRLLAKKQDKLEDLEWEKSRGDADPERIKDAGAEICQIEKELNNIQQCKKRKEEIQLDRKKRQESLEKNEKKYNDLNLREKMKNFKELEEKIKNIESQYKLPKEKEIPEIERNTKELGKNKKVKKTKKKEELNKLEQQYNLLKKEYATISRETISPKEETLLSEYYKKVNGLKEKRKKLRVIKGELEELKTEEILGELEKRKRERGTELDNLNTRKKKFSEGLKKVEERIMALSPSSNELNSAIENIKKIEDAEEEKKKKEVLEQRSKEKDPANIQHYVKMIEEIEEERKIKAQFLEDLKKKVNEKQKSYTNAKLFRKFEDNIRALHKYMKGEYVNLDTDIKKREENIIKPDIKDQNKDQKTKNKKSEEKGAGFKAYIDSSINNMERMVKENTIITEEGKEEIQECIDSLKQECKDINEKNRDEVINKVTNECKKIEKLLEIDNIKLEIDNIKKMVEKNTIITKDEKENIQNSIDNLKLECKNINEENRDKIIAEVTNECKGIETSLEERCNNKQKDTTLEKEIEKEGRVLKGCGQQPNNDKLLAKLHNFINFIEDYNFGTNEKAKKEEVKNTLKKGDEDILNKEEEEEEMLNSNKEIKGKKEVEKEIKEEIISTTNIIEEPKLKKDIIEKNDNIEKEKGNINNRKGRSAKEIIEQEAFFEGEEKSILLNNGAENFHFDENGKIAEGKKEEEIQKNNDENDDKSLIALIEDPEYEKMKKSALEKVKVKEEQKDKKNASANLGNINTNKNLINIGKDSDNKGMKDNLNNRNVIGQDVVNQKQHKARYVLRKLLQFGKRVPLKRNFDLSKIKLNVHEGTLREWHPDHFNYNYNKNDNTVAEKEEDEYIKFKNTWEKESSKFFPLALLRGFGRLDISFLFSTINSIMQFERKDVIGPYFSIYTLSFGKIVQPSFLGKNIYIDISLSILSLLIFSAVDFKIERYYLSKYMIKSPLCKFLSLIKYTTNAFNININFFVNKDFYISLNIMSIFDFILSWYWFNSLKKQIEKDIINECDKKIYSITEERKVKDKALEAGVTIFNDSLNKAWSKHHGRNFLRRILAKNYSEDQKNIVDNNNSFNIIKEENNISFIKKGNSKDESNINNLDDINENGLF